jgi:hypothetical protein
MTKGKKDLIITLKWLSVKLAEKLGIIYKESKEVSILYDLLIELSKKL